MKNDDHTNGSHVIAHASVGYIVVTGDNYASNPDGDAYTTGHFGGGDTSDTSKLGSETGYNILEYTRDGDTVTVSVSGNTPQSTTADNGCEYEHIGENRIAGWEMDGVIREVLHYNVALTAAQIATIRSSLETKYGM